MKVSTMISELQHLKDKLGDVDVLVSDGWRGYFYSGNYRIVRWNNSDNTPFVDIGIGGCMYEDSEAD